jgi:hypothetical protein
MIESEVACERDGGEFRRVAALRSPIYEANPRRGCAFGASAASKEAYAIACVELFTRLWVELDGVFATDERHCLARVTLEPRVEVLRLELMLLLDACGSGRWRAQLDSSQRQSLQSTLNAILDALDVSSEERFAGPIEWAQNRLLDAILGHCSTARRNHGQRTADARAGDVVHRRVMMSPCV